MTGATLFLLIAALCGASGVALGAFGAHGLEQRLPAAALDTWHTAVLYHLLHALALLLVATWLQLGGAVQGATVSGGAVAFAGWAFFAGVLCFSGSLYLLALGGPRWLGPVTPLGGAAFIAGWLALGWAAVRGVGP